MRKGAVLIAALLLSCATLSAATNEALLTTLNCYFFFGGGVTKKNFNQPRTAEDYWKKAVNLVDLLPPEAPLFIGLQEMGHSREVVNFARIAAIRYNCSFQPIFVNGKDTFTGENVAGILRVGTGWWFSKEPTRDPELDSAISKHLIISLTNATTSLELCVVHLRRSVGRNGPQKQRAQDEALRKWAARQFKENPNANLVIFGDFNETKRVGTPEQSLAVLLQPDMPLHDAFEFYKGRAHTHANGKAYDRIIVSKAIVDGSAGLKFAGVFVNRHSHGKGEERLWYTDHFPVTARLLLPRPSAKETVKH